MFSIGFSLSKQAALMVAEKCVLDAVVLHPAASMGEQIVAYSVSNMVQRYTANWLKPQPKKEEGKNTPEIIDIDDEENTDFIFILTPHKENPSFSSYSSHQMYQVISDFIEKDLCQVTCSFLGGSATVCAFSITFGTPTLIGYPVYFLCEWGAGKIGSYIAQQSGQMILADRLLHAVFKSTENYLFEEALPELEEIELNAQSSYTPAYWKEQATDNFRLPLIIDNYFKEEESNSAKYLAKSTSS